MYCCGILPRTIQRTCLYVLDNERMVNPRVDAIGIIVHVQRDLARLPRDVTGLLAVHLHELVPQACGVLHRCTGVAGDEETFRSEKDANAWPKVSKGKAHTLDMSAEAIGAILLRHAISE